MVIVKTSLFLDFNKQVSNITTHSDTRKQFIREYVDKERTKPKKVWPENNSSDMITKNLPLENFKRNRDLFLNGERLNESVIIKVDYDKIQRETDTNIFILKVLCLHLSVII